MDHFTDLFKGVSAGQMLADTQQLNTPGQDADDGFLPHSSVLIGCSRRAGSGRFHLIRLYWQRLLCHCSSSCLNLF